jgi:protein-S-isoprenylcysteine O-methyltransferase Ste14
MTPWVHYTLPYQVTHSEQVWSFFRERIAVEEQHLYDFFGIDYDTYARRTPSAIPFIS